MREKLCPPRQEIFNPHLKEHHYPLDPKFPLAGQDQIIIFFFTLCLGLGAVWAAGVGWFVQLLAVYGQADSIE